MASRDYVKRGANKRPAKKKPAPAKRKPWRSGLVALIVLSGFGFGLYTLSQDPEPQVTNNLSSTQSKKETKPAKVIPPPPEEKWDYVDSLPSREVEVKAKEQVISAIPYIMQCGAYKNAQQAEARKLDIAFQGISSEVRKKDGSSWYRVVLGPYKLKRDAERDKHKLQRAKIEPCAIWKETQ
ncbi:SPOR domain-containing protein [Vibrio fluminensis]|uniref:SPOR domain-containing protein n=1 Tax=Vibrio fluminensis TaxID=2783614 RepID=UPI0018881617